MIINNNQENNDNMILIKCNYNNEIYEIPVDLNLNAIELRQNLFSKLNINNSYILSYKNKKITNDLTPLVILFKDDKNPLLFINDNNTILPSIKQSNSITIRTKIPQHALLKIINLFFQSKYLPLNASIKSTAKDVYNIKFSKPSLASEFLKFYNKKSYINKNYNNRYSTVEVNKNNKSRKSKIIIPKLISANKNKLPIIKIKSVKKTSLSNEILFNNDKYMALYNVIKENTKSDKISEKIVSSMINKYRQSDIDTMTKNRKNIFKKNEFINEKYINDDINEGIYSFPFMSQEEKYIREKFLDKKNWLNKKGFLVSIGKYKMKYNFIPNYVNATPSESPLAYKYRDVDKKKWINKNGFIP